VTEPQAERPGAPHLRSGPSEPQAPGPDKRPPRSEPVSKAAAELMAYCEAHAKEDPLVTPVPSSENPFREKKLFCEIL
uniref:Guanine nucleotide-binding protein subunit gamma n=1 Tax=Astatotilapia calliptera TaxID=8154 RepID=A0AAX7VBK6_ASTCA